MVEIYSRKEAIDLLKQSEALKNITPCKKCGVVECEHLDIAEVSSKLNADWEKKHLGRCSQCGGLVPHEDLSAHRVGWCDKNYEKKLKQSAFDKLGFESDKKKSYLIRCDQPVLDAFDYLAWKRRASVNQLMNVALLEYLQKEKNTLEDAGNE